MQFSILVINNDNHQIVNRHASVWHYDLARVLMADQGLYNNIYFVLRRIA